MRVQHKGQSIYLDQCSYLEKVIERFRMTNAKYARIPLPTGYTPTPNEGEVNPQHRTLFQQILILIMPLIWYT